MQNRQNPIPGPQNNQPKQDQERFYHQGEGHRFPLPLKIAWSILLLWAIYYLVTYSVPDMKNWSFFGS